MKAAGEERALLAPLHCAHSMLQYLSTKKDMSTGAMVDDVYESVAIWGITNRFRIGFEVRMGEKTFLLL